MIFMRIPKTSTLCMITTALNAATTIIEFAKEKPDYTRIAMRALTTFAWATATVLWLQSEKREVEE